jgi:error-prone DNA polymerase
MSVYAELHCLSHYSFLRGASAPAQLVTEAQALGYQALAITDECSLAGVVKAHVEAKKHSLQLIIGSEFTLNNQCRIVVLVTDKQAYSELSGLITLARRRSPKGSYSIDVNDLPFRLKQCLLIWLPGYDQALNRQHGEQLTQLFSSRLWMGVEHNRQAGEQQRYLRNYQLAKDLKLPMVACGGVQMHRPEQKMLHDVLQAIRLNTPVQQLGTELASNAQAYLKPIRQLQSLYPQALLKESIYIANQCHFSLTEISYQYPQELVPENHKPIDYLSGLVDEGACQRWPNGVPERIQALIKMELQLIEELSYEYYFLTVYDIVRFARSQHILCQGRGSAANSVVCYCLLITEISPEKINTLFERFISREREEPPDIDVDFEHERREEVIQYIYQKYGRKRAALTATVITYRLRSAIGDVGKALGLDPLLVEQLSKSLAWWDRLEGLQDRFQSLGLSLGNQQVQQFYQLVQDILGFPRHLSQHVGGFVITHDQISDLVPVENASMPDRTVIQWDKEDIEALHLLKVDVLALGMLTAIKKCLALVSQYDPRVCTLADIPPEDPATYQMLLKADTVGVFQIESRAQMSMLPRLKPRCFYDLVIQIAIVRPGPIQGDMVHPFLRRRSGLEPVEYPSKALEEVLKRTLGVPIFQEQAIKIAMVAAGFSGGEADQLRRAMASWGRNGNLLVFKDKLVQGMLQRGYTLEFAETLFEQIKGFGGYGFPESHSASFALLAYASAWLKCHHPAAFYCSLLNSQPMGFYSPSQLVQDARRHGITVLPVNVNRSQWDHSLVSQDEASPGQFNIRLGFRIVKSLAKDTAERMIQARSRAFFTSSTDLSRRGGLDKGALRALANADALREISGNRYQAHWQVQGIEAPLPLFAGNKVFAENKELADQQSTGSLEHYRQKAQTHTLPKPNMADNVVADYQHTGVSLRPHPLALLRSQHPFKSCLRYSDLQYLKNGYTARVAGLVTGRQRPGTASGTLFLTLEDETGNCNVIVWKAVQQRYRQALLSAKLLQVRGKVECKDSVIHLIAYDLQDYSDRMEALALSSRDFH